MMYRFRTSELVCSQMIEIEVGDDDRIVRVAFAGGCPGNLAGISRLVVGMKIEDVIEKLKGISCGGKPTSCPDQLATALTEIARKRRTA